VKNFSLNLLALGSLTAAQAFGGSIVYSNTTTDIDESFSIVANGFTQVGDQIQLAGTDRLATQAKVEFFNLGDSGTVDATLQLFNVGAPVGSQIGSGITLTGISAPGGSEFDATFALPNLMVPDNLIFMLSIANQSAGVSVDGPELYNGPTIGTSDNTFAIGYDGTTFTKVMLPDPSNVFFELDATSASQAAPEPATLGLMASSLIGLAAFARMRARKAGLRE
jgi:hypothetical protein